MCVDGAGSHAGGAAVRLAAIEVKGSACVSGVVDGAGLAPPKGRRLQVTRKVGSDPPSRTGHELGRGAVGMGGVGERMI